MRQVGAQAHRDRAGEDDRQQRRPVDEADRVGRQLRLLPAVIEVAESGAERDGHATGCGAGDGLHQGLAAPAQVGNRGGATANTK